jgi:hypothetical protein
MKFDVLGVGEVALSSISHSHASPYAISRASVDSRRAEDKIMAH